MADDSLPGLPSEDGSSTARAEKNGAKPATSWILPLITAVVLASAFCVYYFVYVAARRDYLTNRNFRSLAALGDQVEGMVSIYSSVLEFSSDLANHTGPSTHRTREALRQFVVVRREDTDKPWPQQKEEALKDYLKYLAPSFELTIVESHKQASPSNEPRLSVRRRNGHWELVLRGHRHGGSTEQFVGSLDLSRLLKPLVGSLPFDDILLVSGDGTIIYQRDRAGPQFTTLTRLLQAQSGDSDNKSPDYIGAIKSSNSTDNAKAKGRATAVHAGVPPKQDDGETQEHGGAVTQNADPTWRARSTHLTDVVLAGTHYKLFLQPVLIDFFTDESHQEPAEEWIICGLRSTKTLEWEALSISSSFMVGLTALFLAILMSGPVLKIFFINQREHLRLREAAFLGFFLVLLTSIFTLSGLNAVGFPLNDNTAAELQNLGQKLSNDIHDELQDMRGQLLRWCELNDSGNKGISKNLLQNDLKRAEEREVIRRPNPEDQGRTTPRLKRPHAPELEASPPAITYPYINNAFWTDDDGNQIVKWSASSYLTPMIDLSQTLIYASPQSTYLDGSGPAFHFDSVIPPNKLEYLASLTMKTTDCNSALSRPDGALSSEVTAGSAFITAQPLSLIDPILPLGYGFALLDDSGLVLFHADKTRNLHENFLQETDWNKQLHAAVFGHANLPSMKIKYLGNDYQASVVPIPGITQAPWSLIVYRDLTFIRTLNLQSMTMTSMLCLAILLVPAVVVAIWCGIRRPKFAPEWLWPNRGRMSTYVYLIIVYALLIILFVLFAFSGPSEQNVIACMATTYAALLLTALPLLDRPRRHLDVWWKRSLEKRIEIDQISGRAADPAIARKAYFLSLVLLLFLIGVLMPMALFCATLDLERRLGLKQAQLHLASGLDHRLMSIGERCRKDKPGVDELGTGACEKFQDPGNIACPEDESNARTGAVSDAARSSPWSMIVLDPLFPRTGMLPVCTHSRGQQTEELYSGWFQRLIYVLHLDYNQTAAEMLGVVPDRVTEGIGNGFADWSWKNGEKQSTLTLRWHGIHLLPQNKDANDLHSEPQPRKSEMPEKDLLITSSTRNHSWSFAGILVAGVAIVAIGLIVWALVRRIFLFHVDPLKLTGNLRLAESIRDGRSVVVLVPPAASDWHLEANKWTVDLTKITTDPKWDEDLPVNTVIEIPDFQRGWEDPEIKNQKFDVLHQLLEIKHIQVAVIMVVPASPEDYGRMFRDLDLDVIDLREMPFYWLEQYKGPAQKLIWQECGPMAALWPLGAQLARDLKAENIHSQETVASEILERAEGYYRLVWKECMDDQKFVLVQLAEDGLLNPTNSRALRQLVREGLITTNPQFRLMNESFRRFLLSAAPVALREQWLRESRRTGWGRMHGVFLTTMVLLGAFLLTTQNALWQSSAAYVTTALGALGTLAKLFNTYRGGGSTDKAS
jgi:hypothetical protein